MRGIIFSAPMIRALLAGRKTQTRRIIKLPKMRGEWEPSTMGGPGVTTRDGEPVSEYPVIWNTTTGRMEACSHSVGDRLWVRERISLRTPAHWTADGHDFATYDADEGHVRYLDRWPWKGDRLSPIFMPFGCRRIELVVDGVRVERLQDISEDDARAEGIDGPGDRGWPDGFGSWSHKGVTITGRPWAHRYLQLWMELHGHESAHANPWVWALTFRTEMRTDG